MNVPLYIVCRRLGYDDCGFTERYHESLITHIRGELRFVDHHYLGTKEEDSEWGLVINGGKNSGKDDGSDSSLSRERTLNRRRLPRRSTIYY